MKTIKIFVILLLVISTAACSDFLDQKPKTALTQEDVFNDLDNVELAVVGYINALRETQKERDHFMFQLGSDEAKQGAWQVRENAEQAAFDRYNARLNPDNSAVYRQWNLRWPTIGQLGQTAYALENSSAEDVDRKNRLYGEVCYWRAMFSFELCQFWGEIPILDINRMREYGTSRRPVKDVYEFIISDLEKAIQYLPATQDDKSRPTSGIAKALMGKVYLSAWEDSGIRDYAKALSWFEQLTASGSGYSLVASYADLFDASLSTFVQNSSESIYEWQFQNVTSGGNANRMQWQAGSRSMTNLFEYCYFGGYDMLIPTEYYYKMASEGGVWEDGDLRKDVSIRYDFAYKVPNTVNPDSVWIPAAPPGSWGGDELEPHCKKYEDYRGDGVLSFYYSGKNKHYIRLADIWLCQAECLNELGRTSEAVAIVNDRIRTRAWGGTLPADRKWNSGMSQSEFRTMIMDERMRELGFEGWRRMDLIRTGNFVKLIKERNLWAKETDEIQEFHVKYPIPLQEIQNNEDMNEDDQNPGYIN
ncbi:MAG: RagB/SusD family nutrient uptake outer membrane protein [Bacteroidales bacterium]|jgi:tetratricopeptide (TPR) repeat protein|nr:RagB/SusD family nutrient uptake outer membrane protein [Bacteroidales bacterium]